MSVSEQGGLSIYIAGTGQHSGKTLVSLGLVAALRERGMEVRYMKPVGQRAVRVGDIQVDEDVVLIKSVYDMPCEPQDANPITIPSGFTTNFVRERQSRQPLMAKIVDGYAQVSAGADLVVVEGTGHAGVGSVLGLGNAQVASILGSGVVIVTGGGLGRPIDEYTLNRAQFDDEGCRVLGMVANKFLPEKMEELRPLLRDWLSRHQARLLGTIPYEPMLTEITMRQIVAEMGAEVIQGEAALDRRIGKCIIGAEPVHRLLYSLRPGVLAIIPGDRDDLVLAAVSCEELAPEMAGAIGICLTSGILPHQSVMRVIARSKAPVIAIDAGTYDVASAISDLVAKVLPSDIEKIETGKRLVADHVDLEALLDAALEATTAS